MATEPTLARIWRARTRRADADAYEPYLRAGGIPPLEETALGFQLLRETAAAASINAAQVCQIIRNSPAATPKIRAGDETWQYRPSQHRLPWP